MKRMAAAMAAGIVLAGMASASASAAETAPQQDRTRCQSTTLFISHTLCVNFEGDLYDADVVKMEVRASTKTNLGHWELFGPRGTISNSTDGEWKDRTHYWSGYQDGAHGDRWCAVFWMNVGGSYIKGTQPLCVTAGGI
ncbi:hypothetical protein ACFY5C_26645 [Streptomyces sp. NPDC012935]|uniref:hypothetical protein n=1 Tax=Streptomyces sp. NPDC012935 TaxID=3364857 RepID=UPI003692B7A2